MRYCSPSASWLLIVAVAVASACAQPADQQGERRWTFEKFPQGELPTGWTSGRTGDGPGSDWKIVEDESSPSGVQSLAQTSPDGPDPTFNVCVADQPQCKDVDLTVQYKAVAGSLDQGGGPVWRLRDVNNYYVARCNPLENNFRVYRVVDGERTQLATADATAPAGEWGTIRIVQRGDHIQCWLDGELLLDVHDDAIDQPGQIGLWTKADAVTHFDDLSVKELDDKPN